MPEGISSDMLRRSQHLTWTTARFRLPWDISKVRGDTTADPANAFATANSPEVQAPRHLYALAGEGQPVIARMYSRPPHAVHFFLWAPRHA